MMQRELEPEYMDTAEEADGYDSMDHSVANRAFVDRLLTLGFAGRLIDIGTGPAEIPLLFLDHHTTAVIVAIDAAEHMLRHAARRMSNSPHSARLSLEIADAKNLPFADGTFDGVFSNTVMHHIPDPVPYLREAFRVLTPGGTLLIRDLYRPATADRALELVEKHAATANNYQKELFRASLHAALTPDEFRTAAIQAGLTGFEIVCDTDRHMSLQISRKN